MPNASAQQLRQMFNSAGYWGKVQAGNLRAILRDSNPAPPGANEPPGTMSEIYNYWEVDGKGRLTNKVAVVHQYTRPDGTIGGKGRPDPKMVESGGVVYKLAA